MWFRERVFLYRSGCERVLVKCKCIYMCYSVYVGVNRYFGYCGSVGIFIFVFLIGRLLNFGFCITILFI